jgi:hypothetical protein
MLARVESGKLWTAGTLPGFVQMVWIYGHTKFEVKVCCQVGNSFTGGLLSKLMVVRILSWIVSNSTVILLTSLLFISTSAPYLPWSTSTGAHRHERSKRDSIQDSECFSS